MPNHNGLLKDSDVEMLFGEYVFWLLHHKGDRKYKRAEQHLNTCEFTGWLDHVSTYPGAEARYRQMCRLWDVVPEAV